MIIKCLIVTRYFLLIFLSFSINTVGWKVLLVNKYQYYLYHLFQNVSYFSDISFIHMMQITLQVLPYQVDGPTLC